MLFGETSFRFSDRFGAAHGARGSIDGIVGEYFGAFHSAVKSIALAKHKADATCLVGFAGDGVVVFGGCGAECFGVDIGGELDSFEKFGSRERHLVLLGVKVP